MLDWVLLYARELHFTIWLGGLIAIDCIEAPARFRTPELNRNQIVAVGRQVFAAFNRAEIYLGTMLMMLNLLLWWRTEDAAFLARASGRLSLLCIVVMTLIALVQFVKLRPRMTALSIALDLVERDERDSRYDEMRRLHRAYLALDVVKMAAGLIALGFWSLARA